MQPQASGACPVFPLIVLFLSVPVKDNKVNRVADEPGISRRDRKLRQERDHLLMVTSSAHFSFPGQESAEVRGVRLI